MPWRRLIACEKFSTFGSRQRSERTTCCFLQEMWKLQPQAISLHHVKPRKFRIKNVKIPPRSTTQEHPSASSFFEGLHNWRIMMTNYFLIHPTKFTTVCALAALLVSGAAGESLGREEVVEISGTTEFEVPTNMPAVSVKGKSGAAQGRVLVSREPDGILLEHIEASIPIKSLSTGMAVRDAHMPT